MQFFPNTGTATGSSKKSPSPTYHPPCKCLTAWIDQDGATQANCLSTMSTTINTEGNSRVSNSWCPTYNNCSNPDGQKILGGVETPWIYCTPPPPAPPAPPPPGSSIILESNLRASINPLYTNDIVMFSVELCQAVNQYLNSTGRLIHCMAKNCESSTILRSQQSLSSITTSFYLIFREIVSSATTDEAFYR